MLEQSLHRRRHTLFDVSVELDFLVSYFILYKHLLVNKFSTHTIGLQLINFICKYCANG